MRENLTRVESDTTEEEVARMALKDPSISKQHKRKLAKLIERGSFLRQETVVDEKVVKEIEDFHTREIARARKAGKLSDPMTDKFYRERMQRLAKMKPKDKFQMPVDEAKRNVRIMRQQGFGR